MLYFNPRPRAGGDAVLPVEMLRCHEFQSPPPRRGRPGAELQALQVDRISIPAPAQGATFDKIHFIN